MTDTKSPGDYVALMDQLSGMVGQVAMVEGSYFKELIKNSIPYELAMDMVRDWHNMYWQKQFTPSGESYE